MTSAQDILAQTDDKTPNFSIRGDFTAKCVKVYDGDTAHFTFCPFPGMDPCKFSCRLNGINTAEIHGATEEERQAAVKARDALSGLILGKIVTLSVFDFDKYGRLLVDVTYNVPLNDGTYAKVDVSQWMLDHNYARPYTGRGEKEW